MDPTCHAKYTKTSDLKVYHDKNVRRKSKMGLSVFKARTNTVGSGWEFFSHYFSTKILHIHKVRSHRVILLQAKGTSFNACNLNIVEWRDAKYLILKQTIAGQFI